MKRLGPKPGEILDRSRTLSFRFDGKTCEAHPGTRWPPVCWRPE